MLINRRKPCIFSINKFQNKLINKEIKCINGYEDSYQLYTYILKNIVR